MRKVVLVSLLVVLMALTMATVSFAAPARWNIICYHTVRSGETLFCIGRAYGVDPWAIAAQNGIVNPNRIYPGTVLAIPDAYKGLPPGRTCVRQCPPYPTPPCTCSFYHTVVSGNTLYAISLRYGVSMWRIAECNHILNLNYIRIGDRLCIPAP